MTEVVLDPRTLEVGDVIHIRWRGVDRDYVVRTMEKEGVIAAYVDSSGIGSAVMPFGTWGTHLGDPVEVTLVRKAGS